MSEQPYEIELVLLDDEQNLSDYRAAFMATITGLPKEEVQERLTAAGLPMQAAWGGARFVQASRVLSYNVNPKFTKWNPETPWPCIMRVQVPSCWNWGKGNWWALIYNQGTVYDVRAGEQYSFKNWQLAYRQCRITSMLQIWMSASFTLNEKTDG